MALELGYESFYLDIKGKRLFYICGVITGVSLFSSVSFDFLRTFTFKLA